MQRKIFITGTDTNVGKTYIAKQILISLMQAGFTAIGIKPISSGGEANQDYGIINNDALELQNVSSIKLPLSTINPISFELAIAPHIAAKYVNTEMNIAKIKELLQPLFNLSIDYVVIEGAGGWYVPINAIETLADLAQLIQVEIILVVEIKLGCINHALLTFEAIEKTGLKILGWIANCMEEETWVSAEIINTLQERLPIPLLQKVSLDNTIHPETIKKLG